MKLRIWIKIFCTSFVVLTIAGTLGYVSVNKLKRNAASIVHDTLPGLSFAGEAMPIWPMLHARWHVRTVPDWSPESQPASLFQLLFRKS